MSTSSSPPLPFRPLAPTGGHGTLAVGLPGLTAALLLLGLAIRLSLVIGPVGTDDLNYFRFSQLLWHGEHFSELHHHGGRLVFLLLAGIPAVVLGSVHAGAVVCVFWLSLRDLIIVLWLSRRASPLAVAAAAGALALNGLSATYAGLMLPDGLLSLFMALAALLACSATEATGRRRVLCTFGAGLAAGAAYSAKDTGVLIVPCVVAWLLLQTVLSRASVLRALGDAAVFLLGLAVLSASEMGAYWLLSGDPLYRLHAIALTHNTTGDVVESASVFAFVRETYWNLRRVMLPTAAASGILLAMALAGVVTLARARRFAFFAACGLFIGGFLIFGSSSLTRLIPLPVQDRYFEPVVPFLALCAAGCIDAITHPARARLAAAALAAWLVVMAVPAVIVNAGDVTFSAVGRNAAIAIESVHRARPDLPIYTPPALHVMLQPYVSTQRYAQLRVVPPEGELPTGFYLLSPWRDTPANFKRYREVAALPAYLVVDEDQRVFARYAPAVSRVIEVRWRDAAR